MAAGRMIGEGMRGAVRALTVTALIGLGVASGAQAEGPAVPMAPNPQLPARGAGVAQLAQTMMLSGVVDVMQAEGKAYGQQLRDEMFLGRNGAEWEGIVGAIYDPARLLADLERGLETELAGKPEVIRAAQAFFGSPTGQKILSLELEARRALLDKAAEEAAKAAAGDLFAKDGPRIEALRRFAATNDLIEMNVMGGLNANLAFYRGLADGGLFDGQMSESDMLSEVWAQEDQVRNDTEEWLWTYLVLAYQPLSDEELQSYQKFSESAEGKQLNAALFAGFDAGFMRISRDLGRAAARMVQGEDI
ncbi:DUF2059 domain-containing protein [Gemmobacter serpentinus]|uniref:DUF2059 domain-containing protein n=1 Tax=Gemmobacter serpentinus TaxID=2652247 RepID=UPI0018657024|nr:DUF2059 domain-containing protein [Gemmobacter serpentinus]